MPKRNDKEVNQLEAILKLMQAGEYDVALKLWDDVLPALDKAKKAPTDYRENPLLQGLTLFQVQERFLSSILKDFAVGVNWLTMNGYLIQTHLNGELVLMWNQQLKNYQAPTMFREMKNAGLVKIKKASIPFIHAFLLPFTVPFGLSISPDSMKPRTKFIRRRNKK
jgi:hypothetical protein